VRLHLQSAGTLPEKLDIPGLLSLRRLDAGAVAIVRDWTESAQQALERQLNCIVRIEPLGLEEIFLELHR
jgi:hypothetical protein